MANMCNKYNKVLNRIILKNTYEFYTFINEIGGDIDLKAFRPMSLKSYRKNGDMIEMPLRRKTPETLAKFADWYGLDINIAGSYRNGGEFVILFNTCPDLQESVGEENVDTNVFFDMQEKIKEAVSIIEDAVTDTVDSTTNAVMDAVDVVSDTANEAAEAIVAAAEEVVETVVEKVTEIEVPNWKSLSSPTTGKKKLAEMAKKHGIILDTKAKYKEMVAEFQEKFKKGE